MSLARGIQVLKQRGLLRKCTFLASFGGKESVVGYPLRALYTRKGSPLETFARTGGVTKPATYFDRDGVMQVTTTTDDPRINYGYYDTTGWHRFTDAGVLIESAGTNYLTYSIFSAGTTTPTNWTPDKNAEVTWTASLVDVSDTFNVGTTVQAQRLQITDVSADNKWMAMSHDQWISGFSQGDAFTLSVFIKGTVPSGCNLVLRVSEWDGVVGGTVHTSNDITSSISSSEWRKFTLSGTVTDAGTDNIAVYAFWADDLDIGDIADFYIALPMFEKSPHATTFIPTNTAALTRNAETLKYETADNRTAAKESCVVKFSPEHTTTELANNVFIVDTDTKPRRIALSQGSDDTFFQVNEVDDGGDIARTSLTLTKNTEYTIGVTCQHASPYAEIYQDGVSKHTFTGSDFTTNAWGTYFWVGSDNGGASQLNGTIFLIAFFDRVLIAKEIDRLHDIL